MSTFNEYVAIDPLAVLLPSAVYVRLIEKFHPHVPSIAEIQAAAKGMTADERALTLNQARNLAAQAKAVQEAIGAMK
jgi:hypothetical protein